MAHGDIVVERVSSSLAVIHTVDAMKTLLKSLYNLPFHAYHVIKKGPTLLVIHTPQTRAVG